MSSTTNITIQTKQKTGKAPKIQLQHCKGKLKLFMSNLSSPKMSSQDVTSYSNKFPLHDTKYTCYSNNKFPLHCTTQHMLFKQISTTQYTSYSNKFPPHRQSHYANKFLLRSTQQHSTCYSNKLALHSTHLIQTNFQHTDSHTIQTNFHCAVHNNTAHVIQTNFHCTVQNTHYSNRFISCTSQQG